MHVTLIHQGRKLVKDGLQSGGFGAGGVMCDQRSETRQRAELQSSLVLTEERSQHRQSL